MERYRKPKKRLPPEDQFESPEEYYDEENLYNYTHSKSLMWIQEKITRRALEIIDAEPPALILDVGMGCGFSTTYLMLNDFDVVGIELIYEMLIQYDLTELNPVNGDMRCLPFRERSFDYIFSISAFQWIINKLKPKKRDLVLKNAAIMFRTLLKPGGKAILQFYPSDESVLKDIGAIFADHGGFSGNFVIDNPKGSPKRKIYLYLEA